MVRHSSPSASAVVHRRRGICLNLVLFLLPLLYGCTLLAPVPKDPAAAGAAFAEAEQLLRAGERQAAAEALERATAADPTNPATYLRLGGLYELGDDIRRADAAYRHGLTHAAEGRERFELAYRSGLLAALKLDQQQRARDLLALLPQDDPRGDDLAAALAIAAGDGRRALAHLNQARTRPLTTELGALLSYHAARAYHLLGETERALAALYQAVNLAERKAVTKDIQRLRDELKQH